MVLHKRDELMMTLCVFLTKNIFRNDKYRHIYINKAKFFFEIQVFFISHLDISGKGKFLNRDKLLNDEKREVTLQTIHALRKCPLIH